MIFFSSRTGSTFPKVSSSNAGNSVTKKAVVLAQLRSQVWEDQDCWTGIQRKHFLKNYSMSCNMVKERRGYFLLIRSLHHLLLNEIIRNHDQKLLSWKKNTSWTFVSWRLPNPKAQNQLLVGHTKPLRIKSSASHSYVQFKLTQSIIQ